MKALNLKSRSRKTEASAAPAAAQRRAGGRGVTIMALTLALGAAVYLNWSFAQNVPVMKAGGDGATVTETTAGTEVPQDAVAVFDALPDEGPADAAQAGSGEPAANKNYGEAQLVSVSKDSGAEFFDQARLTRAKARDEALGALEEALKKSGLSEEEKKDLTARLSTELGLVTKESDLETLIKAKGFADCVVMLTADSADVTVMTENDALTADEVTRIRDVVLSRCPDLSAQGITVVEVK